MTTKRGNNHFWGLLFLGKTKAFQTRSQTGSRADLAGAAPRHKQGVWSCRTHPVYLWGVPTWDAPAHWSLYKTLNLPWARVVQVSVLSRRLYTLNTSYLGSHCFTIQYFFYSAGGGVGRSLSAFTETILKKLLGFCCCYWSSLVYFMNGLCGIYNRDYLNLWEMWFVCTDTHLHIAHHTLYIFCIRFYMRFFYFLWDHLKSPLGTIREMSLSSMGQDFREIQEFFRHLVQETGSLWGRVSLWLVKISGLLNCLKLW